jgi:hypothetical protein
MKSDIDFDAMRDAAGKEAGDLWDKVHNLFKDTPEMIKEHITWEDCRLKHGGNIGDARTEYNKLPTVKTIFDSMVGRWIDDIDIFFTGTREKYVLSARNAAGCTFAYVRFGIWHERGSMGWFACVSDGKDKDTWYAEFAAMIDALPDNTVLTLVDCHI